MKESYLSIESAMESARTVVRGMIALALVTVGLYASWIIIDKVVQIHKQLESVIALLAQDRAAGYECSWTK